MSIATPWLGDVSSENEPCSASIRSRMPSRPSPRGVASDGEADAVVTDTKADAIARDSLELDLHLGCRGVLRDVGQALLRHSIETDVHAVTEVVDAAVDAQAAEHIGMTLVPTVDQILERPNQAELVEQHGAQAAQHSAHDGVHLVGDLRDRGGPLTHGAGCGFVRLRQSTPRRL